MIGARHDVERLREAVDFRAPCERLEADAQAVSGGAFRERRQLFGDEVGVTRHVRLNVRTHQEQRRSQLPHQFELALGSV